jgi:hypothetical protein
MEHIKSFSNKKTSRYRHLWVCSQVIGKKHKNSNKYGTGMEIKETKTQFGLDKEGGRNCFTNIAVK